MLEEMDRGIDYYTELARQEAELADNLEGIKEKERN